MVDHNHDRIKAIDSREVSDEVHREVLEKARAFKSKRGDGWECRVGEHFICLAYHTSRHIFPDIGREAQPLVALGEKSNGLQVATVATLKGAMGSRDQVMVGNFRNVEAGLVIKMSIIKGPIIGFQSVEEGELLSHLVDGLEKQQVTGGSLEDKSFILSARAILMA